jgi:hypothetical protein
MGLMMCDGKFVSRDEVALVPTPGGTESWKPVPHMEVIDAVTDVVKAHNWQILDENFGLAREGQKMFDVMRINKSNSSDWWKKRKICRHPYDPYVVVRLKMSKLKNSVKFRNRDMKNGDFQRFLTDFGAF